MFWMDMMSGARDLVGSKYFCHWEAEFIQPGGHINQVVLTNPMAC